MHHTTSSTYLMVWLLLLLAGCATQDSVSVQPGDEILWLDSPPALTSSIPAGCEDKLAIGAGDTLSVSALPFDFDSASLRTEAVAVLDCVARYELDSAEALRIQGHTDSVGSQEYNQALGDRRAINSALYLQQQGVDPRRMSTESYGENAPVASNESMEGRARNRRVEIVPQTEY